MNLKAVSALCPITGGVVDYCESWTNILEQNHGDR